MSTGLPRPRLARSAHRGRMLLRGYVSKSSAVLNRLTITQLASLREVATSTGSSGSSGSSGSRGSTGSTGSRGSCGSIGSTGS